VPFADFIYVQMKSLIVAGKLWQCGYVKQLG